MECRPRDLGRVIAELHERALKICAAEDSVRFGKDWTFAPKPV